jgi:hypothetical protein
MKNDRGCRGIEYPKSARTRDERKEKLGSEPSKENKKKKELKLYMEEGTCVFWVWVVARMYTVVVVVVCITHEVKNVRVRWGRKTRKCSKVEWFILTRRRGDVSGAGLCTSHRTSAADVNQNRIQSR